MWSIQRDQLKHFAEFISIHQTIKQNGLIILKPIKEREREREKNMRKYQIIEFKAVDKWVGTHKCLNEYKHLQN
jgi:hypothetical protein